MRPTCPRCHSRNVSITEFWKDHTVVILPDSDEGIQNEGEPYKVTGRCLACDHRWRFRGITQIKDEWLSDGG